MHIGLLILCGFLIGFILIFLGMGAALYIGCLITIFHLSAKTAAASALVVTLPALIIGTLINHRTHTIDYHRGNFLLKWALLGTIGGSLIVPFTNHDLYQLIISVILIILASTILWNSISHSRKKESSKLTAKYFPPFASIISGVMVGLAGMSGGGPLVAGMLLLDAPVAQAAATSSYIQIWTTLLGVGLHWHTMTIAWQPVLFIALGTALGAACAPLMMRLIGQRNRNFISRVMKPLIAIILLYMGVKPFI